MSRKCPYFSQVAKNLIACGPKGCNNAASNSPESPRKATSLVMEWCQLMIQGSPHKVLLYADPGEGYLLAIFYTFRLAGFCAHNSVMT